ncbi:hypothetical protein Taro_042759 [Colocasia esculenta]|uniref:Zinc finger C3HC4 RING-type domain-containing protein n=1 Tax=Colocasia esculenta TaxID=4460 RepID=A0A843WJ75_COLES|nr:hypothetical protein [Colocasia esculenta]
MECLHRFCRECIDKSMRLGFHLPISAYMLSSCRNNECPACRTHCASRRSLRDDPNYDALIAALYPDIDKYEEEELAFHEEDKLRNKKIQASIAETYQRQSEALGKRRSSAKATAAAFLRRSQGNFRTGHGHNSYPRSRSRGSRDASIAASDEDDEDANGNEGGKDSSSADESSPDVVRHKRRRRWGAPRFSPAPMPSNIDESYDEHDDLEIGREPLGASPGRVGNREVLVWGKNGARSQTRHGSSGGSVGKNAKGSRITRLVEYLRNLDENDNEVTRKRLSIFIAHQIPVEAEEVEILARKPEGGTSILKSATLAGDEISPDHAEDYSRELQILEAQESLAGLHDYFTWSGGNLVLVYRSKSQHKGT